MNIAFCFYTNTHSPQQSPSLAFSSALNWGGTFCIAPKSWQGLQKEANVSYWCCLGSSVDTWVWMEVLSLASWPSASSNVKRSDKTNIILAVSQDRVCHAAVTSKSGNIRSLDQQKWMVRSYKIWCASPGPSCTWWLWDAGTFFPESPSSQHVASRATESRKRG